ncbi:hypothetical protein [Paenibacillus dakarensis]|uniref:hypothetical protein n=1 Tax=Paenibacillus dakarensis TaxID=1527293 RepID=UPI000A808A3F|nr:hypothetical protein [Paenibacillus dakarensis]
MTQPSGDEVRNHQSTETDSKEQRDKVKKDQDVEPQAEEWNPRPASEVENKDK